MTIHNNYAKLGATDTSVVDSAYDAAVTVIRNSGLKCAADDRAEYLIEAIATYLVESQK